MLSTDTETPEDEKSKEVNLFNFYIPLPYPDDCYSESDHLDMPCSEGS